MERHPFRGDPQQEVQKPAIRGGKLSLGMVIPVKADREALWVLQKEAHNSP
jgi:hypothetical protein